MLAAAKRTDDPAPAAAQPLCKPAAENYPQILYWFKSKWKKAKGARRGVLDLDEDKDNDNDKDKDKDDDDDEDGDEDDDEIKEIKDKDKIKEIMETGKEKFGFVQFEDGRFATPDDLKAIRGVVRRSFQDLVNASQAPASWSKMSTLLTEKFEAAVYRLRPELALCQDNWKLAAIATDMYPSWIRRRRPEANISCVKVEPKEESPTPAENPLKRPHSPSPPAPSQSKKKKTQTKSLNYSVPSPSDPPIASPSIADATPSSTLSPSALPPAADPSPSSTLSSTAVSPTASSTATSPAAIPPMIPGSPPTASSAANSAPARPSPYTIVFAGDGDHDVQRASEADAVRDDIGLPDGAAGFSDSRSKEKPAESVHSAL